MMISVDKQALPPLPSKEEMRRLAENSDLVRGFAQQIWHASSFCTTSEFKEKATLYLAPYSQTLKRCSDVQSQLEVTNNKLKEIQRGLNEKLIAIKDPTEEASLRAYREQTHRSLESLKGAGGSHSGTGSSEIPDLNTLWREADALLTRNQSTLAKFSKDLQSSVTPFTQRAEMILDQVAATDAITKLTEHLCTLSSYYPRGLSPEAEAARSGDLLVSGDSETMQHVLSSYVLAEMVTTSKAAAQLPTEGYFAELAKLKKQLSIPSRSGDLGILTQLKDLYISSGSTALAFYAALNCIAAGDTSHPTLFLAFENGEQLGSLTTLAEALRNVPNHTSSRSILLQLYRIALHTDDPSRQDLLTEFKTKHLMSAEKSFAEALEYERRKDYDTAKRKAVSAWSHAKDDPAHLSHLALHAMKLAHQMHFKMSHTSEENTTFSETVATHLLKLDPEDSLAWEILCRSIFDRGGPGAHTWATIDQLLSTVRSSTGAYVAGTYAERSNDTQRMQHYFSRTGQHSVQGLRAKIALADLAHTKGDTKKAVTLLEYVSIWAPHHPLLPRLVLPGTPLRVPKPGLVAPHELLVGGWKSTTRQAVVHALQATRRGMPPAEALSKIPEYAQMRDLLQHDSPLVQKCRNTARELKEHIDTLTPLANQSNPHTWGHLLWSPKQPHWSNAVHIHEALNPDGHKHTLGQLVNLLDDLERAITALDPWVQHFAPLRLHERLYRAAQRARRACGKCNELFTTSRDADAKAQSVVELISEITQVRDLLINEVSNNLRKGMEALADWTEKLLLIPTESLLENKIAPGPHAELNKKVRLRET